MWHFDLEEFLCGFRWDKLFTNATKDDPKTIICFLKSIDDYEL